MKLRYFDSREATADSSPGIHAGVFAVRSTEAPKVATQLNICELCRRLWSLDNIEIHDASSNRLNGMSIAIENYVPDKDMLGMAIDDQLDLGIEAHFDSHKGVLTLHGNRLGPDPGADRRVE